MDPGGLRAALRRRTDEGVIEESTAERIRSFEEHDGDVDGSAEATADESSAPDEVDDTGKSADD